MKQPIKCDIKSLEAVENGTKLLRKDGKNMTKKVEKGKKGGNEEKRPIEN